MDGRQSGVIGSRTAFAVLAALSIVAWTAGQSPGAEIIGGAIYTDLANPLTSGLSGVTVTVTGTGGTTGTFTGTTAGAQGLWQINNVPDGTYAVTPSMTGKGFEHTVGGVSDGQASLQITVDQAHRAAIQSIQFLALPLETIRGAVYTNLASPLTSGLAGVTVTVTRTGPITATYGPTTAGVQGVWQIDVPAGTYTVTPALTNRRFEHVVGGSPDGQASIQITVNAANRSANQSIQFWGILSVAARLAFTAQPAGPYEAGAAINAIPQVTVQDAGGATVSSFSGNITIALGNNPAGATLSGTKTVAATAGVASFPGLSINRSGVGYTLTATSGTLISATSNPFNVIPSDPTTLVFTASPGTTAARAILTPHPRVEIRDASGNLVTDSTAEVTIVLTGSGVLGGTTTVNAVNGVATFTDLTVGTPGTFPGQFTLTATSGSLTAAISGSFEVPATPALTIEKKDSADPVEAGDEITYTITYGNNGLAAAQNVQIRETLPQGLEFDSSPTGVHSEGTITWNVGTIAAETNDLTVSFVARVAQTMADGGTITNSNLIISATGTPEVGQTTAETTDVNDTQAPTVTLLIPDPNAEQVALKNIVRIRISDNSGVDLDDEEVKIQIEGCIVYDSARESSPGVYDSNSLQQAIRGICRRTGTATDYTFTFIPSVPYGYEKDVDVRVEATDEEGHLAQQEYSFWTQTRVFGANAKVNSDPGAAVQDNPATAADSQGDLWVVWDQTSAGDTDVYAGVLPEGEGAFQASVAVATGATNQRDPAIAIDVNDRAFVVWQARDPNDPNSHWDIYVSSSANGTTWSTPVKVNVGDPNNTSDQTAPAIVADTISLNKLYVVFESTQAGNKDIWLATSTDGTTWEERPITTDVAEQSSPVMAVDPNDNSVYVIWTDARNAATTGTDLWGARSADDYEETPVVNAAGDQSAPTGAVSDELVHLAWVASLQGFGEILYAEGDEEPPWTGESIIDPDEDPDFVQGNPALAVRSIGGQDTVFAAWEDSRDVNDAGVDIYFAESSSPFGTNILVNKDTGANSQTKPVVGVSATGDPYVVWVDNRNGSNDIYYAGAMAIGDAHATEVEDVNGVVTVSSLDKENLQVVIEDPNVLPEGIDPCDITFHDILNPPPAPSDGLGLCYDFGPSGTQFSGLVRIRIPLDSDAPVRDVYHVYRYDLTRDPPQWVMVDSPQNPVTRGHGLHGDYLEVGVDHFTAFATGGVDISDGDSDGDGGGCALAPWGGGSPWEFGLPFVAYILVLFAVTCVDRRRRRSVGLRR